LKARRKPPPSKYLAPEEEAENARQLYTLPEYFEDYSASRGPTRAPMHFHPAEELRLLRGMYSIYLSQCGRFTYASLIENQLSRQYHETTQIQSPLAVFYQRAVDNERARGVSPQVRILLGGHILSDSLDIAINAYIRTYFTAYPAIQ